MRLFLVGSEARAHQLALMMSASSLCTELYVAPGNPGIARVAKCVPVQEDDITGLTLAAIELKPDLVVVGPEITLALGLGNRLAQRKIPFFGPSEFAALLESRKSFAKQFMDRHGIRTAKWLLATTEAEIRRAAAYFGFPKRAVVLKADGLASGKGVYVVSTKAGLEKAILDLVTHRRFGSSAPPVVVEEKLDGSEVSILAICSKDYFELLPDACDYKQAKDGDTGSNTGGMGAHSPSGLLTQELWDEIRVIFKKVLAGMREWGHPFIGVLYAGLMLTRDGIYVLEFNVRFGDPECQVVLPRLEDDIVDVMFRAATNQLRGWKPHIKEVAAACTVLAGPGYPDAAVPAGEIRGIEDAERIPSVRVLHAGTSQRRTMLIGGSGRVLNVCASAATMDAALQRTREAASLIHFENGMAMRSDIGHRYRE